MQDIARNNTSIHNEGGIYNIGHVCSFIIKYQYALIQRNILIQFTANSICVNKSIGKNRKFHYKEELNNKLFCRNVGLHQLKEEHKIMMKQTRLMKMIFLVKSVVIHGVKTYLMK